MKLRLLITLLLTALLLGGCSSSSGVTSRGADTYSVEAGSEFGLAAARERAFEDASAICSASGERVSEISSRTGARADLLGDRIDTYELVFQCGNRAGGQPVAGPPLPAAPQPQLPPANQPSSAAQAAADRAQDDLDLCSDARDFDTAGIACTRAINSGHLSSQGFSLAYFNRAILYARIGDYERAVADLDDMLGFSPGDRKAIELRQKYAQAALPPPGPMYSIYYQGLFCPGVPKDTIMYPAAELFLTTTVFPIGNPDAQVVKVHPGKGSYYPNVKPGFKTRTHSRIWSGRQNRVRLAASLWEHDGGGKKLEQVALVVAAIAIAAKGKGGTRPSGQPSGITIRPSGNVANALFGTGHDLLGISYFSNLDLSYFIDRPKRNDAGILNHLVTSHKQGGADCRVYFSVETN